MAKKPNFAENAALKPSYNDSLFKKLWGDREKVLDKYPKLGAGLVLSDPSMKIGDATYSFKINEIVDKVSCTSGGVEFRGRYKKDTKKFDVTLKQKVKTSLLDSCTPSLKYEDRNDGGAPHYVLGCAATAGALSLHAKLNPMSNMAKMSCLYDCKAYDVKVAADVKASLMSKDMPKFNVGMTYKSPAGVTGLAYSSTGDITANQCVAVDKTLTVAAEVAQKKAGLSASAGVAYKLDSEHELRTRVNNQLQVHTCLKKSIGKMNVQIASVFDLTKPDAMLPSLGFKVAC